MSDVSPKKFDLPHLGDELLWKIFVKSDPKTVGRCRSLNRVWSYRLSTPLFVKQNFRENKDKDGSVIIGIGYPPTDENSQWFVRADVETGRQFHFGVPMQINHFGYYSLVGDDHGNLCIRLSYGGLNSRIIIWNPLTRDIRYISDEASKHCCHAVSLYAFGYLQDQTEYRIVHVYKRHYAEKNMKWTLFNSIQRDWVHSGTFQSNVHKLGPKPIVQEGVVSWIGWEGVNNSDPAAIITFSLQQRKFSEDIVPEDVKASYHALIQINDNVGFMSYKNLCFTRQVSVWGLKRSANDKHIWEKMVKVTGLGMPYSPTLFVDKDVITLMEARTGFGTSNDGERTDILLSRLKYMHQIRKHLVHRTWNEAVSVKSVSLHSNGLYMV
ncbi:F-box/kelch-repeat protein At3g23880-like [Arachis stenosperma]|uniref:F-box/kelch-repeat protein At3g23880-like n=1 Tax=Arachis stenosperma TaxID=217475 RepID=UPI0025AD2BCA|nr:F-box/kelch-repeat protein At3g23880-like [Arachis stenosperma]